MTIVVFVKITPDTARLGADPRSGEPRIQQAPCRISTFDENALEEAVRLAEAHGGRVIVISLSHAAPPRELLLKALAMGADEIRMITDPSAREADALATATILSRALRLLGDFDVALCGEGSIDEYGRQVGPRIAEAMGIPVVTRVEKAEAGTGTFVVDRVLEDRIETVEARLPVLLTVGAEINQPRLPTVLQILGASRKPIIEWSLADLGFEKGSVAAMAGVRTIEINAPGDDRQGALIPGESAVEMAGNLAHELAVKGLAGSR
jgi:electron transfer flavoprotein beta subunit